MPAARSLSELTKDTLAKKLYVKQAEISKIESRADMLMSTRRNFVPAMGGELEVRVVFPDCAIEIITFSCMSGTLWQEGTAVGGVCRCDARRSLLRLSEET